MAKSPIHLDVSACSVVVTCTEHDYWQALANSKDEGWISAAAHEERLHPNDYRVRNAALMRRTRHAAKS